MTPRGLDGAVVQLRLRLVRDFVDDLLVAGEVTEQRLLQDRLLRHAVERVLTQLVDLATGINCHVVAARTGHAPQTYRDSFGEAAGVGMISDELAAALGPAVGMRNLLVHEYADIDLGLVAAAVPSAIEDMGAYVREVAGWLESQ